MIFIILIMGCILMVFLYRLYEMLKAMYAVRKFFRMAVNVEQCYCLYTLATSGEIESQPVNVSVEVNITNEDIKDILHSAETAISYCDKNNLRDFEEPILNQIYSKLEEIASELRRWLWVNKESDTK